MVQEDDFPIEKIYRFLLCYTIVVYLAKVSLFPENMIKIVKVKYLLVQMVFMSKFNQVATKEYDIIFLLALILIDF